MTYFQEKYWTDGRTDRVTDNNYFTWPSENEGSKKEIDCNQFIFLNSYLKRTCLHFILEFQFQHSEEKLAIK